MKNTVKLAISFLLVLTLFTSCRSYKIMHFSRDQITNVGNVATYKVYIHDKNSLYKVDKPNLSSAGVKGDLTPVLNPDTVAEIKDPHTRKQFKRQEHDLVIYTKAEVKNSSTDVVLKKNDIADISHIVSKVAVAEDVGTVAVLGLGVVVWVLIIKSFQGLL